MRFDAWRIGVAGFGIGGRAALLARAEAWGMAQLGRSGPRVAAHAALLLEAGGDSADATAECAAAVPVLPMKVLNTTHAWDLQGSQRMRADPASVPRPVTHDPAGAAAATERLVAFFAQALRSVETAAAETRVRPGPVPAPCARMAGISMIDTGSAAMLA